MSQLQSHETTPLLIDPLQTLPTSQSESELGTEIWVNLRDAVPISLTYMLQNSLQTLSIFLCGRLAGKHALTVAAVSYASSFSMIFITCSDLFKT